MKQRLQQWLTDFVAIAMELSDVTRDVVLFGQAQIIMPTDVLFALLKHGVVFEAAHRFYFPFEYGPNPIIINVLPEPDKAKGHQITIQARHVTR